MRLLLASPAFRPAGEIPPQYTCDGAGPSQPLACSGRCPLKGHGTHDYRVRPLAIGRPTLDLKPTASPRDVLRTAQPYAIQLAVPIGTYHR